MTPRDQRGRFTAVPDFAPAEDAHEAATVRQERADQIRNSDVREAYQMLRDGDRSACIGALLLSIRHQCRILGTPGPELIVGVAP